MEADTLLPIEQDTSLVSFTITINGEPLAGTVPVFSVEVHNQVNRIPAAYIIVADGDVGLTDWPVSNDEWFIPGNEIEIKAGYHSTEETIFKGIVVRHSLCVRSQKTELRVECRDKALLMTTTRNSNIYNDVTDSDIAATILDAYSLTGDIEDIPVTHAEMVQYDCSDWDFLLSRLDAMGFVTVAKDGKIDIIKPKVETTATATLSFGRNLVEFDAEVDGSTQFTSVKAQSWDPGAQELVEMNSGEPEWTTPGNFDPSAISSLAGTDEFILRQAGRLSEEEVQNWADAKLLRSRMAFICGRARVEGFAAIPGITVEFQGMGDRINGMGWISGVRHEISHGNWLTDLQFGLTPKLHTEDFPDAAKSANILLPGIQGLHTAIVTTLEADPDGEARIRVKIPSVSMEGDGIWARVSTLDAGNNRGTFFLPEIGDEVVVGFLENDPRQPVILGGLHSSANATPLEATDDNHEKGYFSRSGMSLLFNDDKISFTISTPAGNTIAVDDDKKQIGIEDQHGNKIVMSSDGISIESAKDLIMKATGEVKIESQKDLGLKAGIQFKAEGTAGLEIKSSATTVVKGSIVQIN